MTVGVIDVCHLMAVGASGSAGVPSVDALTTAWIAAALRAAEQSAIPVAGAELATVGVRLARLRTFSRASQASGAGSCLRDPYPRWSELDRPLYRSLVPAPNGCSPLQAYLLELARKARHCSRLNSWKSFVGVTLVNGSIRTAASMFIPVQGWLNPFTGRLVEVEIGEDGSLAVRMVGIMAQAWQLRQRRLQAVFC